MADHSAAIKVVSLFLAIVSIGVVTTCILTSWLLLGRRFLVLSLLLGALVSA